MTQNSIRRCPSLELALLVLVAHGFALGACGGPSEGARSPSPPQATPSESGAASSDDADADDTAATQESEPTDDAAPAVASDTESAEAPAASAEPEPETRKPPSKPAEGDASAQLALELEKRRKAARAQTAEEDGEEESNAGSAAPAAPEATGYDGPDPCRATSFSLDRVREACSSGGRAAAKRVMKDAITKAIATSQRFVCADCHSNQRDYSLKPNAVAELKRLLES